MRKADVFPAWARGHGLISVMYLRFGRRKGLTGIRIIWIWFMPDGQMNLL